MKEGLITEEELQEALEIQAKLPRYKPLGQILVDHGIITLRQLDLLLDAYHKRPRLGEILLRTTNITQKQLDLALKFYMPTTGLRIGESLLKLNWISDETLKQALALQLNISVANLDALPIDARARGLINRSYAEKHGVLPISLNDKVLTVAMEDPTDRKVIHELESMTGLRIQVVLAHGVRIGKPSAKPAKGIQAAPEPRRWFPNLYGTWQDFMQYGKDFIRI